jgi:hypothetical protein
MKTNPPKTETTLSSDSEPRLAGEEICEVQRSFSTSQSPKVGQLFSITATLSMIATRPPPRVMVPNRGLARRARILEYHYRLELGMLLKGMAFLTSSSVPRTPSTLRPVKQLAVSWAEVNEPLLTTGKQVTRSRKMTEELYFKKEIEP